MRKYAMLHNYTLVCMVRYATLHASTSDATQLHARFFTQTNARVYENAHISFEPDIVTQIYKRDLTFRICLKTSLDVQDTFAGALKQ
jgi:hypothetical protein